jgi:hypothetical protein
MSTLQVARVLSVSTVTAGEHSSFYNWTRVRIHRPGAPGHGEPGSTLHNATCCPSADAVISGYRDLATKDMTGFYWYRRSRTMSSYWSLAHLLNHVFPHYRRRLVHGKIHNCQWICATPHAWEMHDIDTRGSCICLLVLVTRRPFSSTLLLEKWRPLCRWKGTLK